MSLLRLPRHLNTSSFHHRLHLHLRPHHLSSHPFTTLAIESSCDDTCIALLHTPSPTFHTPARLLFHQKYTSDNRPFGGVNPPFALASHDRSIGPLLQQALATLRSHVGPTATPNLVAVTRGPGMSANLAVGLNVAKGAAIAWDVPFIGVNHMQAHALTPRLVSALSTSLTTSNADTPYPPITPKFPFLSLLVSGGHTLLVLSTALTTHRILCASENIALGDALDKCARHILPTSILSSAPDVMYARSLEAFAFPPEKPLSTYQYVPSRKRVDEITPREHPFGWTLRPFLAGSRKMAYNFSDAESQVIHLLRARGGVMAEGERRELAIDIQRLVFEHLIGRVVLALEGIPGLAESVNTLVLSGGVACNKFLMKITEEMLAARGFPGFRLVAPPVELCTDNAAMIAWTGLEMYKEGYTSDLGILPLRKWSVDPDVEGGILGRDGWIKK